METIKKIKVPVIGGYETRTEITTDTFRDVVLGSEIHADAEIFEERVDHIEADCGDNLVFSQGVLKKSKIKELIFLADRSGARTCRYVRYAL